MGAWPCRLIACAVLAACGRVNFDAMAAGAPGDGALADGGAASDGARQTYRDVVLADSPLAYWRLADTGTTARDETGNFDGTYLGGCTHSAAGALAGDPDLAVDFDGSSCLIELGDVLAFPGVATFTLEMWARFDTTRQFQILIMKQTRSGPNPVDGYALLDSPMGMYLERYVAGNGDNTVPTPIANGRYLHLVAVYDGTRLRLYIDGIEVPPSNPATAPMPAYSAVTWIGAIPPQPGSNFFAGLLDEIAVYGSALSPARVALHYDLGINGPR